MLRSGVKNGRNSLQTLQTAGTEKIRESGKTAAEKRKIYRLPRRRLFFRTRKRSCKNATYAYFAAGAFIGITSFSRLLSFALKHFRNITLAVLTGFMLGSLNKVWPWKEIADNTHGMPIETNILPNAYIGEAIALMVVGFLMVYFLEKLSKKADQ